MDFLKIESEFKWVLKVLNSCQNISQINVVDTLFYNYKTKWVYELSDIKLMTLSSNYEREKSLKISQIQKNH
jgi:hypothetical protein